MIPQTIPHPEKERGMQRLSRERIEEFRRLQYGMFIHFGMPTFAGPIPDGNAGKINPYRAVPLTEYNPRRLDVDQWIRTAKDAGMRYAVLIPQMYADALMRLHANLAKLGM
jgi:alpha-L-fucosidase